MTKQRASYIRGDVHGFRFTLKGAELQLIESVIWHQDQWGNDIYYYTTESEYDTENAEIISKEQSDAIKGEYVYEHTTFIPFEKNNQDNRF